ncbi:MAG: hypothetical protein M1150_02220 [Patescibacteria group bacterium]|nr:hypothetical protein [Patescibacteria group bacterium]
MLGKNGKVIPPFDPFNVKEWEEVYVETIAGVTHLVVVGDHFSLSCNVHKNGKLWPCLDCRAQDRCQQLENSSQTTLSEHLKQSPLPSLGHLPRFLNKAEKST